MNAEVKGHEQGLPYKVRLYKAHITCTNEILNAGLDPDFLQDLQFTIAKNMCLGDLAATMEELHAEIENEAGTPGFEEWAKTVAALHSQRLDLIDESEKHNEDMERRWGQDSTMVGGSPGFTASTSTQNRPLPPSKKSNTISWPENTNSRMAASLKG